MTIENELPIETGEPAEEAKSGNEKTEEIVKLRLRQANMKHEKEMQREKEEKEQLKAELEAIKKSKENNGNGASEGAHKNMQMPSEEMIDELATRRQKAMDLGNKINEAKEKDPEFAKLSEKSAHGGAIPPYAQASMTHLPNAVAVMKHLLKDPRDYKVVELFMKEGDEKGFVQFVNGLSEKLEKTSSKPAPSNYAVIPDMSDAGESAQDFDEASYIRDKY
jgi:hypothetical protein